MSLFISMDAGASPWKLNTTCTLDAQRTLTSHFHSELEVEQMPSSFFAWRLPSNMLLDFLYWPHVTTCLGLWWFFSLLADSCFWEEPSSCSASILPRIHTILRIASFLAVHSHGDGEGQRTHSLSMDPTVRVRLMISSKPITTTSQRLHLQKPLPYGFDLQHMHWIKYKGAGEGIL